MVIATEGGGVGIGGRVLMAILLVAVVAGGPCVWLRGTQAVGGEPLLHGAGGTAPVGDYRAAPPELPDFRGAPWSTAPVGPSDVAGTVYAGPVSRLQALGVLTGDGEGAFRPADTITRAEASAVLVRLRGFTRDDVARAGVVPGRYADVPVGHWAAGYVNLMDSLGVVRGYADGTFRPEGPVTRAEFLTMLLRLLGYGERLQGSWPERSMGEAERLGLIADREAAPDEPVTRGEVAVLVDLAAHRIPVAPALDPAGRLPVQVWLGKGGGAGF